MHKIRDSSQSNCCKHYHAEKRLPNRLYFERKIAFSGLQTTGQRNHFLLLFSHLTNLKRIAYTSPIPENVWKNCSNFAEKIQNGLINVSWMIQNSLKYETFQKACGVSIIKTKMVRGNTTISQIQKKHFTSTIFALCLGTFYE